MHEIPQTNDVDIYQHIVDDCDAIIVKLSRLIDEHGSRKLRGMKADVLEKFIAQQRIKYGFYME
jgi:hypothetical protein